MPVMAFQERQMDAETLWAYGGITPEQRDRIVGDRQPAPCKIVLDWASASDSVQMYTMPNAHQILQSPLADQIAEVPLVREAYQKPAMDLCRTTDITPLKN